MIGRLLAAALLLLGTAGPASAHASDDAAPADVASAKLAWLGHVTRFVTWPEASFDAPEAAFRLCVLGHDPFGERLHALQEQRVAGRPIQIEHPQTLEGLARCQLAYFGSGADAGLLRAAQDGRLPTLLGISSDPEFARRGGMLALVGEGADIHLHVNLGSVHASRLDFSAKLLELAQVRHTATTRDR